MHIVFHFSLQIDKEIKLDILSCIISWHHDSKNVGPPNRTGVEHRNSKVIFDALVLRSYGWKSQF